MASNRICIVSVDTQTPLVIVQTSVGGSAEVNPVTPEVGEVGVVIVAVPLSNDHTPVPTVGVLPAKVAVFTVSHKVISAPALAVVGVGS